MKKVFLVAGILLIAATVTFAHTNLDRKETRTEKRKARKELRMERRAENRNEVSIETRDQFETDFTDARNVQFVKTKNFDEVSFLSGKKKLRAYYDYHHDLVGTIQRKSFTDLPENAQSKIEKGYGDYTVSRVIKFDDNEDNDNDMRLFGKSFDPDNYFVELKKTGERIVVEVDLSGDVSFFASLK